MVNSEEAVGISVWTQERVNRFVQDDSNFNFVVVDISKEVLSDKSENVVVYKGSIADGKTDVAVKAYKRPQALSLRYDYLGLQLLKQHAPDNSPKLYGYTFMSDSSKYALVVEFVDGNTVAQLTSEGKPVPGEVPVALSNLVSKLHSVGLLAGDLLVRPDENVMVDKDGKVMFAELDVGVATEARFINEEKSRLEQAKVRWMRGQQQQV